MNQTNISRPTQVQWEDFANAIIIQAAQDYRKARYKAYLNAQDKKAKDTMREIERFFFSEWYQQLTNVDGRYLLNRLRSEKPGYRVNTNGIKSGESKKRRN